MPLDKIEKNHIYKNLDFQLYNDFQPGMYRYSITLNKINQGKIFLKVYEITENTRLSEKDLNQKTILNVENSSDSLKTFQQNDNEHFTIYEGDWGKFYGATFEVWFKDRNGKEIKLTEKNYKINGWQR